MICFQSNHALLYLKYIKNHVPVQKTLQMVYKRSVEAAVTLKSASNTLLLMKKAVQDHISLYKPEEFNENFESFLGVVENISEVILFFLFNNIFFSYFYLDKNNYLFCLIYFYYFTLKSFLSI